MVSLKQKTPINKHNKKQKQSTKIEKAKLQNVEISKPIVKVIKENKMKIKDTVIDVTEKKKTKYIMPSENVTENVVNSCLNALQVIVAEQNKKKNAIFDDEKSIFAELHSIKIQNTKGNVKFVLPHSTVASTGEVCLITPDIKKGRKHDHEPTVDHWEEILRKAGVTTVKTVLPLRQLRVEYDQFELKRRLLTQHDFILVDTRVLSHASHLLGKMFFKKHNMLVPVRLNEEGDLKKAIDIGLHTAILRLSEGETSTVVVGHTAMPNEQVKDNILSMVQQLKTKFPGGEVNIRSISIKLPLSVSLPIYFTLRPSNSIKPPKVTQCRPKNFMVIEDELSTIPGKTVCVAPDGTVKLKKVKKNQNIRKNKKEQIDDEDIEEEEEDSDQEQEEESD